MSRQTQTIDPESVPTVLQPLLAGKHESPPSGSTLSKYECLRILTPSVSGEVSGPLPNRSHFQGQSGQEPRPVSEFCRRQTSPPQVPMCCHCRPTPDRTTQRPREICLPIARLQRSPGHSPRSRRDPPKTLSSPVPHRPHRQAKRCVPGPFPAHAFRSPAFGDPKSESRVDRVARGNNPCDSRPQHCRWGTPHPDPIPTMRHVQIGYRNKMQNSRRGFRQSPWLPVSCNPRLIEWPVLCGRCFCLRRIPGLRIT